MKSSRIHNVSEYLARSPEVLACMKWTSQWLPLTLTYLGMKDISYPYTVRLRAGSVLTLQENMDVVVFWLVFARDHYPVHPSDRVIIDVGANIGLFTLYAAAVAPAARVLALEPFPVTFNRLTEHIKVNGLQPRTCCLSAAITGSAGTALMDLSPGVASQYRSVLHPLTKMLNVERKNSAAPSEGGVEVRTVTLEHLLSEQNIQGADLLKMNIHGNEYDALLSTPLSVLGRFRRIAVQYHEAPEKLNLGKRNLFEYLGQAGFQVLSDVDTKRGSGRAVFAQLAKAGTEARAPEHQQRLAG